MPQSGTDRDMHTISVLHIFCCPVNVTSLRLNPHILFLTLSTATACSALAFINHPLFGLMQSERPLWSPHLNVWELILGRPGVGRSTPQNGNFRDSYSGSSYWADQVLADLPPNSNFRESYSWDLILGIPGVGRFTPPHHKAIRDSYPESSHLADQVLPNLPPQNDNFRDWNQATPTTL